METPEINIAEILKYCPKGMQLYSPCFGYMVFDGMDECYIYAIDNDKCRREFWLNGTMNDEGECMLFPSYDQRNWSKFEPPVLPPFEINRVKEGEMYWYFNGRGDVKTEQDLGYVTDEERYDNGNYFNTREQADYACDRVQELLLSLRKEEK